MLGEYDNGSASEYIWLPREDGSGMVVGMYRNGSFYAVHADHLGTPRLITDEGNKPVWQWPYSAFGNNQPTGVLRATPNPKMAITNQPVLLRRTNPPLQMGIRMPGQYADEESGLFYNWMRFYDASEGRFTQFDPIGLDGGWNRFAYVEGNPLSNVDPRGLATFTLTGGGSAVVVGGGEGSFGVYISNKPNDIGIVVSGGAGGGANVGLSAQLGYVPGPLSNVSGNTQNTNLSCVVGSGTWMTDPKTGNFAGATVGPAGRLGASVTNAQTETWGLRGLLDRLFDKIGGIK